VTLPHTGLATIKVADFSTHVSGPTASLFLRAVGAEVVKVENPRSGDGNRMMSQSPQVGGASIYHHALNWGAKSVAVDARSAGWGGWVAAMAGWADVVIVGGRPSDTRRLGLDRASIAAHNPRAIHCHISGYGPTGPWAERAAHGQNADALAGLVDLTRDEAGDPVPVGWRPAGTSFAGVSAAIGILGALVHRAATGTVLAVETSLWESALWWNWREITAAATVGESWGKITDFGSRYCTYRTSDDRAILIAAIEQKFWEQLCDALGLPDLRERGDWSSRYDFGAAGSDGPERRRLATVLRSRTLADWIAVLEPAGVPFCEILTATDVLQTDQFAHVGMIVDVEASGPALRPPLRLLSGTEPAPDAARRLPELGEHTEEFRRLFGLAADE
jgi:crotonobetainyl-CoA:carnitine CoA-transferase CaiB-like acyl-CoA transferase